MITETSAVTFRQNLGEMLNRVQYRHDSVIINKDGKPVAALVDARLFEDGMNEGAGAALAVRAGHMDEFHARTRQAQLTQQAVHTVEAQLDAEELRGVEPVELRLRAGSSLHASPRA